MNTDHTLEEVGLQFSLPESVSDKLGKALRKLNIQADQNNKSFLENNYL